MAFVSGSVYVALMLGFVGESVSWVSGLSAHAVWYVVCIVLVYVFCLVFCKPTDTQKAANVEFIKDSYKALGKLSTKEKQGIIIVLVALILWLTQSTHKIDAGMVAILTRRCIYRMRPDHSSRGRRKGHVDHHHLRRRRSLRCRPYGILGVSTWLAGILETYPRTHHEQPLDLHPPACALSPISCVSLSFPSPAAWRSDRDLRLAARGSRHQHLRSRIHLLGIRHLLERFTRTPASWYLIKIKRSFLDFATASKGLLRLLHHQPYRNDLQCASGWHSAFCNWIMHDYKYISC